jgi:hypothetical protein
MKYFLSLGSNIDAEKNLDFAEKELIKSLPIQNHPQSTKLKLKGLREMIS